MKNKLYNTVESEKSRPSVLGLCASGPSSVSVFEKYEKINLVSKDYFSSLVLRTAARDVPAPRRTNCHTNDLHCSKIFANFQIYRIMRSVQLAFPYGLLKDIKFKKPATSWQSEAWELFRHNLLSHYKSFFDFSPLIRIALADVFE